MILTLFTFDILKFSYIEGIAVKPEFIKKAKNILTARIWVYVNKDVVLIKYRQNRDKEKYIVKYNQWFSVIDLTYVFVNLCHDFFVTPNKNNFIIVNEINVRAKISMVPIF